MNPKHKTPVTSNQFLDPNSPQVTSNQSQIPNPPRVAIVHDWFYGGGAELVVEQLHKMYPEAPIYTSFCTDEWRKRLDNKVVTGYLQHWPFAQLRKFLPVLRQHWFKNLDLSEFDLVISSSGNGESKFVLPKQTPVTSNQSQIPGPTHICYCHTPPHFYWRKYEEYLKNPGFRPKWLVKLGLKLLLKPLRKRDYDAAQSVDYFIANSSHIQNDIKKYYGRDSTVIAPPVDVEKFATTKNSVTKNKRSGFITWGRLVPYKRVDLVIKACDQLQLPLTVAGTGPMLPELKKIAGPTITFTGYATHEQILEAAQHAKAFIFAAEEDFGIAPVEAMALGLPVIAYKSGGALDYVDEQKTGLFFKEQTAHSIKTALSKFDLRKFEQETITKSAEDFSEHHFQAKFKAFIASIIET